MFIKLRNREGNDVYVNTDYIVEIMPYNKAINDPNPNIAKTIVVFNAAGHAGLSLDVVDSVEDVIKKCAPITSKVESAGNSISSGIKSLFGHN